MSDLRIDELATGDIRRQTPGLRPAELEGTPKVGGDFGSLIGDMIQEVNTAQVAAQQSSVGLARGEVGIVDTVLAIDKASVSLKFLVEMRNKALDAYQQIMRSI